MSRIVEGIKELLKGKDDDDYEYRYRNDQRGASGSERYGGYPMNASPKGRSGYPADGRSGYPADGRSGYPADGRSGYPADGRSGYPAEGRSGYPADGRSGYPADGRSGYPADGRSGYPANGRSGYPADGRSSYPADGRSGYPADGRSGYPADGRSAYPGTASVDGRSGYPADGRSAYPGTASVDGRSGYPADGRSAYPGTASVDGRSAYPGTASVDGRSAYPGTSSVDGRNGYSANSIPTTDGRSGYPVGTTVDGYRVPSGRQSVDDDYIRSSYDTRREVRGEYRQPYTSTYGSEYGRVRDASPRAGFEHRASPRVEIPARGEYARTTQPSPREYQSPASGRSVVEFMVPMCCEKCKEKVQEELSEVEGVDSVRCDPKNSRVIVTGDRSIDIERCLAKAERAVKKKCELVSNQAEGGTPSSKKVISPSGYYETVAKTGILTPPSVSSSRGSPSGGPTLTRMPSFASGKVTQHDGIGPRGQDYEAKDYTGFRRMPSLGKSRHHEAEYISSYDERPEPRASSHREFNAPIRRMPSFNRSRYHDAEYMAADDDRDYSPRSFYDNGSSYTASYNDRPSLLSQVSFSKIPVENPNYVKQIANY